MLFKCARSSKMSILSASDMKNRVVSGRIKEARFETIALDPNHFYLDVWAVSALEKWGHNENYDAFERAELLRAYLTFVGAWSCLDHNNTHASLAIGLLPDAVYTPDDYVRIVHAIDRKKAEARHPGLEHKIATGEITDTSMGTWARESVCSIPKCANVATCEDEFCDHIRYQRGDLICNADTNWKEIIAFEINRGCVFFEDSLITDSEGADRNAKILNKLAMTQHMSGPISISADKLYMVIKNMAKTASREEVAILTNILEQLMRVIDER